LTFSGGDNYRLGPKAGPLICGVDEAGRGPLAGPVVAAAVILSHDLDTSGIADSKSLSPRSRSRLKDRILESSSLWGVGIVEPEIVDQMNILRAALLAMRRAVEGLPVAPDVVLVDGNREIPDLPIPQRTIIGGDSKEKAISAASILAKTLRDDIMTMFDREFPGYGFRKHKGYPTREHIARLHLLGPCSIHRKSFRPIASLLANPE
jgi:ribonuclease HII